MKARRIYELLEQKRDAFERFLSATRSLRDVPCFEQNRERIESLIGERQECIGAIGRIDGRIEKLRREVLSLRLRLSGEAGEQIARVATAIADIAAEAERITAECETMIARWRDDTKNQMIRIRQGRNGAPVRADTAYRVRQPKFLDMTL